MNIKNNIFSFISLFDIRALLKRLFANRRKRRKLQFKKRKVFTIPSRLKLFEWASKSVVSIRQVLAEEPLTVLPLMVIPLAVSAVSTTSGFDVVTASGTPSKKKFKYTITPPQEGADNVFINANISFPVYGTRVSSTFGERVHPVYGDRRMHTGIDIAAPKGTPVYAAMDGVVKFSGWLGGYGNTIQIQHADGYLTVYAHLSKIDVTTGQYVRSGQKIGEVGATGTATGPHLHFETRYKDQPFNPGIIFNFNNNTIINTGIGVRGDNDILKKPIVTNSYSYFFSQNTFNH